MITNNIPGSDITENSGWSEAIVLKFLGVFSEETKFKS